MKKSTLSIAIILAVCLIMTAFAAAQDTKQTTTTEVKKFKVSDDFLNTWKKVGNMTKEIRSFKTEKSKTVAGVRGAEAEDEALKHLYYKGGIKYPSRLELKNAITILENFIIENPRDSTIVESHLFIAHCFQQLEEPDKAIAAYNKVIELKPDSDYAILAKEEIEKLKKGN
ncbi:tol-pal system YbgF family protein [candidate division KSB1 bacterium]